jgi:hypothetical protein
MPPEGFVGRPETVFLDTPFFIINFRVFTNIIDAPKNLAIDGSLFQCTIETFSNSVGLRLGNEGKAGSDTPELDLVLKKKRHHGYPQYVERAAVACVIIF